MSNTIYNGSYPSIAENYVYSSTGTSKVKTKSENVNAPVINELAVCVECKVKSYDENICRLVGQIVNVSVDEATLTDGKVDVAKVAPITFDPFNNEYYVLGEKVGNAFSDGKAIK